MRIWFIAVVITAGAMAITSPAFASDILSFDLIVGLNGDTPPTGPAPWLQAIFTNVAGGVELTLANLLPCGTEFARLWMFNLDPALDPLQLDFSIVSGTQTNAVVLRGEDAFRAAGGDYFDILFAWPTANSQDRFTGGEAVTYLITSSQPITATSFDYLSTPGGGHGPCLTVAKVQGGDPDDGGGWITVPEPTSLCLFGLLLAVTARRQSPHQP